LGNYKKYLPTKRRTFQSLKESARKIKEKFSKLHRKKLDVKTRGFKTNKSNTKKY